MKRKKALVEFALWSYIIFSSACLILYLVPTIDELQVFRTWLLCTNIFRFCLAVCMCVLVVKIIRLQKIRKQLKKWRS